MSTDALSYPVPRTEPTTFPEEYAQLRRDKPVCPISMATGDPALMVTRHEDVKTVLADRRFSRAAMCAETAPRFQEVRPGPDSILSMDPPRHTRIRKLAAQAFTAKRVEQIKPRLQEITDRLLDEMAAMTPPIDLKTYFARPLPLQIICEMLGVPFEDQATFIRWTECIMSLESSADQIMASYVEMRNYFAQILESKRANPGDDLITELTQLSDEEGTLTAAEVISMGTFLLVAGHDTSVTVLTESALTLMRNPEQLAELRANPELWPNAVEELLRLTNPGGSLFPRIATTDVELSGTVVPAGSAVLAHIGSGCRDESVVEDGDSFDIHRNVGFQIFFGHGPHFCLGAALGRAETEIGLRSLFDRFPTLSLAVPQAELNWQHLAALGGWESFPVTWK